MAPKISYAVTLFGSQNRPWRPRRLLDALWSPFGSLLHALSFIWIALGSILLPFASVWLPFGCMLVPFRSSASLLAPFSLHFFAFLNVENLLSFFFIWIACSSVFGRTPSANTILGHPTPQDPQQNYSRISTVGTPTLLRPGRACCRRQLKVDE